MKDLEFSFEQAPWEAYLSGIQPGGTVAASALLTMLEGETDDTIEEAFELLEERELTLSCKGLAKAPGTGQAAVRLHQEEELVAKGLNFRTLAETDPLRLYLEELAMLPAFGDEARLVKLCAKGDADAAMQLTNLGLSRVVELAKEYVGLGVLLLDLIQEGSLGLWQCISSYQAGDYAAHRDRNIRNTMGKAVLMQARSSGLGQKLRTALQDYRAVDERLLSELGRNPTTEEMAQELHMTREEAETVKKMMDDAFLLEKAAQGNAPKEEEAPEENQAVEDTAYFQMRQRIAELLSVLPELDAKVLTLRYGLEKGLPLSAEETARKLGMTPEEVTKREIAALSKLRQN